jgi:endoglucanase
LFRDGSLIPNLKLRDFVVDTAKEMEIPIQFDMLEEGGTDGGAIHLHKLGVPSLVLSVPTRHIHSHIGIMHREDYENAVKLLVGVIKRLDTDTVAKLTE